MRKSEKVQRLIFIDSNFFAVSKRRAFVDAELSVRLLLVSEAHSSDSFKEYVSMQNRAS